MFKNIDLVILMDISNNGPKLVCRKCQGPHLTIKCGKESKSVIESKLIEIDKPIVTNDRPEKKIYKRVEKEGSIKSFKSDNRDFRGERKPLYKVKMSNLPLDMTEAELNDLLYEWGHVVRMRLLNYESSSTAYIEFKEKEAADYIVQALHKTPFEHILLEVERLEN